MNEDWHRAEWERAIRNSPQVEKKSNCKRKTLPYWTKTKVSWIWVISDELLYDLLFLYCSILFLQCWKGPRRVRMTSSVQRKLRTTSLTSHLLVRTIPETQYTKWCHITASVNTVQPSDCVGTVCWIHTLLVHTSGCVVDVFHFCDRLSVV